jgi:pimeloyl-ACP methyl ester carboxylesterase
VAAVLAGDREVVAYDARGYGNSSWSLSANCSLDAQLSDIAALADHLGWERPVLLGHSRGGSFTLRYAHSFPERVGAAIFRRHLPGTTARGPAPARPAAVPSAQPVYPTLADGSRLDQPRPRLAGPTGGGRAARAVLHARDGRPR